MVLRVRYPKLTVSKAVGIPVVVFLLGLPFGHTKLLAGFMLCVVLVYTFVSPFLVRGSQQQSKRKGCWGKRTVLPPSR